MPNAPQPLVGGQELARLFGVNRARAHQITRKDGFPEPIAVLSMGTIWRLEDVQDWADRVGRTLDLTALERPSAPDESPRHG